MSQGRLLLPLVVLAVVVGRAASQTPPVPCDKPAAPVADSCHPSTVPAPRVRVIVPPPEIIFCPPAKRCFGLFHHHPLDTAACVPAVPYAAVQPAVAAVNPATTQPGGGMLSFN